MDYDKIERENQEITFARDLKALLQRHPLIGAIGAMRILRAVLASLGR